jgi:hypothetical protein
MKTPRLSDFLTGEGVINSFACRITDCENRVDEINSTRDLVR